MTFNQGGQRVGVQTNIGADEKPLLILGSNDRVLMIKVELRKQSVLSVIDASFFVKATRAEELKGWEFSGAWVKQRVPVEGFWEYILIFLKE